jgi:hypothetical protein
MKKSKTTGISLLIVLFCTLLFSSCGGKKPLVPPPPRNKTETVLFRCDRHINAGMALPVEVIYVTADDSLKQVTQIGPDAWFDSKEREGWPFKQTFMLTGGQEILVKLKKPAETKFVVIFATFYKVKDKKAQQVILDPNGEEQEIIWVAAGALYH